MKSTRTYDTTSRAAGAEQTRQRIIAAGSELLLARAYEDVTLADLAREAGVSHQTVLNHFGSKEGVATAVVDQLTADIKDLRSGVRSGDLRGAVRAVVSQYEESGDSNVRWAMAAERLGSLAGRVAIAREYHQQWLERVFAEQLPPGRGARRRAVNALHAATDVYTWKLLRRDLGLGRRETENTIADMVGGILGGELR